MIAFESNAVTIRQERYDELLHKEALLESIEKLRGRMTNYAFYDAVGYLLKAEVETHDA